MKVLMNAKFDWKEFERLQGMTMARYVMECAKRGDLPADCVSYVKANAERLDGQHLEMALFLLDKIGSEAARHELVNYLAHPLEHIRLTVIGMLDRMDSIDGYLAGKIRESIESATDAFGKRTLRSIYKRATRKQPS